MGEMSTLSWDHAGTKRTPAWDCGEQRVPKLLRKTSPSSLCFRGGDGGGGGGVLVAEAKGKKQARDSEEEGRGDDCQGGTVLRVKEFPSPLKGTSSLLHGPLTFDKWLVQNRSILHGKRVLELKSGAGALAIFLRNALGVDVTTSDSDDKENEHRIADNCRGNSLIVLPHILHTWGDPLPVSRPDWEVIIASDIESYADQSANLVKTLSFLLKEYKPKGQSVGCTTITNKSGTQVPVRFPICLISWRRRVDPSVLFLGCEHEGLEVQHLGYLVYLIQKKN